MPSIIYITASSLVHILAPNNVWLADAFQYGDPTDLTWSFTGKSFLLDVKAKSSDVAPLLALSSAAGTIVVDDVVQRILHLNVSDIALRAALPIGGYVYDLIIVDDTTGERDLLQAGKLIITQGVTVED